MLDRYFFLEHRYKNLIHYNKMPGLGSNIFWLSGKFLAFKKVTRIEIRSVQNLPFPSVTVCDLNPFRLSRLAESRELTILYKSLEKLRERLKEKDRSDHDRIKSSSRNLVGAEQVKQRPARGIISDALCFTLTAQGKAPQGEPLQIIKPTTILSCLRACLGIAACEGYKYDSGHVACTLVSSSAPLNGDSFLVSFYTRKNHAPPCDSPPTDETTGDEEADAGPCFERLAVDQEPEGFARLAGSGLTAAQCAVQCKNDASCKVIVWLPNEGPHCFFKDVDPETSPLVSSSSHAISFKRTCFDVTSLPPTTSPTTTTTIATTETTTPDPTTTNDDIITTPPHTIATVSSTLPPRAPVAPNNNNSQQQISTTIMPPFNATSRITRPSTILILYPKTETPTPTDPHSNDDYYDKIITDPPSTTAAEQGTTESLFERLGLGKKDKSMTAIATLAPATIKTVESQASSKGSTGVSSGTTKKSIIERIRDMFEKTAKPTTGTRTNHQSDTTVQQQATKIQQKTTHAPTKSPNSGKAKTEPTFVYEQMKSFKDNMANNVDNSEVNTAQPTNAVQKISASSVAIHSSFPSPTILSRRITTSSSSSIQIATIESKEIHGKSTALTYESRRRISSLAQASTTTTIIPIQTLTTTRVSIDTIVKRRDVSEEDLDDEVNTIMESILQSEAQSDLRPMSTSTSVSVALKLRAREMFARFAFS